MAILFGTNAGFNFQKSTTTQVVYTPVDPPSEFEFNNDLYNLWNLLPSFYKNFIPDQDFIRDIWKGTSHIMSDHLLDLYQDFYNLSADEVVVYRQKKWQILDFLNELSFGKTFSQVGNITESFTGNTYYDITASGGAGLSLWGDIHSTSITEDASLKFEVNFQYTRPTLSIAFGYIEGIAGIKKNGLALGIKKNIADNNANLFAVHYDKLGNQTLISASSNLITKNNGKYFVRGTYIADSFQFKAEIFDAEFELVNLTSTGTSQGTVGFTNILTDTTSSNLFANVVVGDLVRYDIQGTAHDFLITEKGAKFVKIRQQIFPCGSTTLSYKIIGKSPTPTQSLVLDVIGQATDYKFTANSFGYFPITLDEAQSETVTTRIYNWKYLYPALLQDAVYIPKIQDKLFNPSTVLEQDVHFFVNKKVVQFSTPPFEKLYAPYIAYDDATIFNNFGAILGIKKEPSSIQYRDKVRGILRAYLSGPTISSLRSALNLFFGLPVAIEAGTVQAVNTAFTGKTGRISILEADGDLRHYIYPSTATNLVSVSDSVVPFQSLCSGLELKDYISHPEWVKGGLNSELEKIHSFLVSINLSNIGVSNLPEAASFINTIIPTYKKVFFDSKRTFLEDLDMEQKSSILILSKYSFFDNMCDRINPHYDSQNYTFGFGETSNVGEFDYAFDQGFIDWQPVAGLSTDQTDGVAGALLEQSFLLTENRNGGAQILDGHIVISTNTTATGSGTEFTTEIPLSGTTPTPHTHLILFERKFGTVASGTGAVTVSGNKRVTLSNGHGVLFGDYIRIGSIIYLVADAGATHIDVVPKPSASETSDWDAFTPNGVTVEMASVNSDTQITLSNAPSSNYQNKQYLATLADSNYLKTYFDQYAELCPEESIKFIFVDDSGTSLETASEDATFGIYNESSPAYAAYNSNGTLSLGSEGTQATTLAEPTPS